MSCINCPSGTLDLTATINANLTYISTQEFDSGRTDENKGINYSIELGYGSNSGEISELWHTVENIVGTGTYYFNSLPAFVFDNTYNVDFTHGNVKALKLANLSLQILRVQHPFDSGELTIFPSGSLILTSYNGLIPPSGSYIRVINEGPNSQFKISALGVGESLFVSCGFDVNAFDSGFC